MPTQRQYPFARITRAPLHVNKRLAAIKLRGSMEQPFTAPWPLRVKQGGSGKCTRTVGRGVPSQEGLRIGRRYVGIGTGEVTSCQRAARSVPLLSTSHRISWAAIQVPESAPCVGRFNGSLGATGDHDTHTCPLNSPSLSCIHLLGNEYLADQDCSNLDLICAEIFMSTLISSAKLVTISMHVKALNSYHLSLISTAQGPIKSTATSCPG